MFESYPINTQRHLKSICVVHTDLNCSERPWESKGKMRLVWWIDAKHYKINCDCLCFPTPPYNHYFYKYMNTPLRLFLRSVLFSSNQWRLTGNKLKWLDGWRKNWISKKIDKKSWFLVFNFNLINRYLYISVNKNEFLYYGSRYFGNSLQILKSLKLLVPTFWKIRKFSIFLIALIIYKFFLFDTANVLISIECRAWAKNIQYRGGMLAREGSVQFDIMLDNV